MDEHILICIFVLAAGACIGSFLNVAALRALSKESIVFPGSKCPKCNTPIKWFDNIPVLSYFLTFHGKCRSCGEKVSVQYPIVEALTAVLFLAVFLAFGISVETLLLIVLLCISIVIAITDLREEVVFDTHSWILIITALIFSTYENDLRFAVTGCLMAAVVMEILARISYYIIKKDEVKDEQNQECSAETENKTEEISDINKYIKQNKRAFGEGDTYLAAAVGAILGVKYFIVALVCAIILQAICILPQFLINLYKQKEIRLLTSIVLFALFSVLYFGLANFVELSLTAVFIIVAALIFFAADVIIRLKKTVNKNGFKAIPFGPALLFTAFVILFFSQYVMGFIKKFIFMI